MGKAKGVIIATILCVWCIQTFAQNFVVKGNVRDSLSGEDVYYAWVSIKDTSIQTSSNLYGVFALTVPPGDYILVCANFGYEKKEIPISVRGNLEVNVQLAPKQILLQELTISAKDLEEKNFDTKMSELVIDPEEITKIPVLFGEKDVLKTIQLLPGVKGAGEGSAGFYVRGGTLGQNLVLLDEAPIYNASHLLGFFSVFNSDALKDVTLYKGVVPAEYGGRASSVMDIRLKDGSSKNTKVSGGIGLVSSRLSIEQPIVKNKGSFMVSGRRTYADLFLKLSADEAQQNTSLYFYDLNLKANYRIGDDDRIFLSGYFGQDRFSFSDAFGIDWGNKTMTTRWNHWYSDKLFSNTSLIYSDYGYDFSFGTDEEEIRLESRIRDWNLKHDFTFFLNNSNELKFGTNIIHHLFGTGDLVAGENSGFLTARNNPKKALEGALYFSNKQQLNSKITATYGLRYSMFNQIGADTAYTFDDNGEVLTTTAYGEWEGMQFYDVLEPRVTMSYDVDSSSKINVGVGRNAQYVHLLTNSTSGSPTDLWVPSSQNIKPELALQVSGGYFKSFKNRTYEASGEVYYKDMQQLVDYKIGADIFLNETIESELIYGKGHAYGLEILLRKRKGKLTGWFSYTYSRTLRNFEDVDGGATFSARQDRIHDLAIVGIYELSKKWSLSANWVFYTGDAVSFPSGQYTVDGIQVPYYTERNGYRMPNYHRLDVGATWVRKRTEKFESSWNFSVYNAYGRENAYQITFQEDPAVPGNTQAIQLSLFKWVPSFSYNFKFK